MYSTAILPATKALLGKLKCTAAEAAEALGGGSLLLCSRDNGPRRQPTLILLYSGGGTPASVVGTRFEAHHDQTLARYGTHEVLGVLNHRLSDGKLEVISNDFGGGHDPLRGSAPLFVYK